MQLSLENRSLGGERGTRDENEEESLWCRWGEMGSGRRNMREEKGGVWIDC